jgi:serine/threonine protein kinase
MFCTGHGVIGRQATGRQFPSRTLHLLFNSCQSESKRSSTPWSMLPPGERPALLDRECAGDAELRREVEALLAAHDRAEGILEADALKAVGAIVDPPKDERIGPYRVLRRLGRGGMGVVYLAERDDGQFRRRVAIKVWPAAPRTFSSTAASSPSGRSSPRSTIRT